MKKAKKVILHVCSFSVALFSLTSVAFASPLAECYGWNYHDNNVDTTTEVNIISSYLNQCSYNSKAYTGGTSAYYVRNTMASDAILYTAGHGNSGIVECRDPNNNATYLTANISSNNIAYSLDAKFGGVSGALRNIRLACFFSCNSALSSSTYGNLLDKCTAYGVNAVVGFKTSVQNNQATTFDEQFMYSLSQGYTVNEAIGEAIYVTGLMYNYNYGGVDQVRVAGAASDPGSLKITPAAYGN